MECNPLFFCFCSCVGEEVTSGQIEIDLKWGIIPLPAQKQDFCTALKQSGKACPLEPGTQTMTLAQTIPSEAPSVSHHLENIILKHCVPVKCLQDSF